MVAWWVVALAILFPLAQVPLVLWIGRYLALDDDEEPATTEVREFWTDHEATPAEGEVEPFDPEEYDLPENPGTLRATPDGEGSASVTCPECGTENEVSYRYCGDCAAALT
jgi:hypothetical protein